MKPGPTSYLDEWVILVDLDADVVSDEEHSGVVFTHSMNERKPLASTTVTIAGKPSAVQVTDKLAAGN